MRQIIRYIPARVIITVFIVFSGCAYFPAIQSQKQLEESQPDIFKNISLPAQSAPYDFSDVPFYPEMNIDKKNSFVYQTQNTAAGLLTMKGKADMLDVIDYYNERMPRYYWKQVGIFKGPKSILLYQNQKEDKPNRWCIINIIESNFFTNVEIWVSPSWYKYEGQRGMIW